MHGQIETILRLADGTLLVQFADGLFKLCQYCGCTLDELRDHVCEITEESKWD